jgi:hypothetical protein
LRQDRLDAPNRSEVVRVHHGDEGFHGQFFHGAVHPNPGIVDEDIDWRIDRGEAGADGVVRIDIEASDLDREILLGGNLAEATSAGRVPHRGKHAVSRASQFQGGGESDSHAAVGDQNVARRVHKE